MFAIIDSPTAQQRSLTDVRTVCCIPRLVTSFSLHDVDLLVLTSVLLLGVLDKLLQKGASLCVGSVVSHCVGSVVSHSVGSVVSRRQYRVGGAVLTEA